jgi:hypothetical protein
MVTKEIEKSDSAITDEEIDEAVAQIMEYAGVATRDSGWEWRQQRDYAKNVEIIIRQLLGREFKEDSNEQPLD